MDVSQGRLRQLEAQCERLPGKLEVICADAFDAVTLLSQRSRKYDLIAVTAFLHHVPDYLKLLRQTLTLLAEHGQVLTFEDPIRYDSMRWPARLLGGVAYFSWRLLQGDVVGGTRRYLRRRFSNQTITEEDDTEYHVVRNGVDQEAVASLLREMGMQSKTLRYFSTQGAMWQAAGRRLGLANSFAIVARRASV